MRSNCLRLCLCLALCLNGSIFGQAPATPPKLTIRIVEGEGAINNIRARTAREAIVQVEDENRKPVAGALVTFTLPNQGAGGVFAKAGNSLKVLTDSNGRAVMRGLQPSKATGNFQIQVSASAPGQSTAIPAASTVISQSNAVGPAMLFGSVPLTVTTVAVAGAVVAGATVLGTQVAGSGAKARVSIGTPTLP